MVSKKEKLLVLRDVVLELLRNTTEDVVFLRVLGGKRRLRYLEIGTKRVPLGDLLPYTVFIEGEREVFTYIIDKDFKVSTEVLTSYIASTEMLTNGIATSKEKLVVEVVPTLPVQEMLQNIGVKVFNSPTEFGAVKAPVHNFYVQGFGLTYRIEVGEQKTTMIPVLPREMITWVSTEEDSWRGEEVRYSMPCYSEALGYFVVAGVLENIIEILEGYLNGKD